MGESPTVFHYIMYHPSVGDLLPKLYSDTIKQRYGVALEVVSPLLSYAIHKGSEFRRVPSRSMVRLQVPTIDRYSAPQCVYWEMSTSDSRSVETSLF